ncbi:MAG: helix-turn-helix domain-containing protein [Desulfobulbus sp.]|jgi:cytoskeletal protein RodZ|uniref:helix-turn-helix domain-containing protein n=1 Tax=Desulfobulbus sp. TaxID=895 RepID=UPI00284272A5|nr:helix-turn-helix domain-containing protein [Desulfobulbus sp.]MDR2550595.1 helix-turn-helix domain-containing protein [Desulfobulbus sp.]
MSTEETSPQLPADAPLSVGEQLRQARRDKSLSLEEIATATRISRTNLEAIENMDFGRLPADSFTRGQITLYAASLDLDGGALAARFFLERDGGKRPQLTPLQQSLRKQQLAPKKLAEPAHVSSATIAGILFLLIVCSFTAFCLYFSWNPFAFLTDKLFPSTASTKSLFHPADPATSNGGQHNNVQVQAFFKQDCRVLVTLDHKPAFEHTYPKGASVLWEADKQMSLEFFQPDSAELQLNGTPLSFPAGSGGRYLLHLPPAPSSPATPAQ